MGYVLAPPTLVAAAELGAAAPASASVPTVQLVAALDLNGLLTDAAMVIADELDIPLANVNITLADAHSRGRQPGVAVQPVHRPSNSMRALYPQLWVATAVARGQLDEGGGEGARHTGAAAHDQQRRDPHPQRRECQLR